MRKVLDAIDRRILGWLAVKPAGGSLLCSFFAKAGEKIESFALLSRMSDLEKAGLVSSRSRKFGKVFSLVKKPAQVQSWRTSPPLATSSWAKPVGLSYAEEMASVGHDLIDVGIACASCKGDGYLAVRDVEDRAGILRCDSCHGTGLILPLSPPPWL